MAVKENVTLNKDIRDKNVIAILEAIKNNPGINVNKISEKTGISRYTVSLRTRELEREGVLRSEKVGHSRFVYPVSPIPEIEIERILGSASEPTEKPEKRYSRTSEYTRTHQYSKETADKILEVIRNNPGISTMELISKTNLTDKTVRCAAIDLENDKVITSSVILDTNVRRHVKRYWLAESETKEPVTESVTESKKEENEVERYPDHKNDEGYNDLTAAPTIRKLDDIFGTFAPGAVWTLSTAYRADAEYLVLRSYKGWVTGMMLQDDIQKYSPVYCVPVSMRDKRYVDCRRILTKPSKYFIEKKYDIPNFERVKSKICYLLGIEPEVVEKIVEKPVEVTKEVEVIKEVPVEVIKEVEKPVEVIKEVPVEVIKEVVKEVQVPVEVEKTVDAVDTALLRQRADIYEKIAWQFLNTLSNVAEEVK